MHERTADQGVRVVWIEPRRLAEVLDRLIEVTPPSVDEAAVPQGSRELWIEPERFVVVAQRTVVVTSGGVGVTAVVEREEDVGMREVSAFDRQRKVPDRRIEITALVRFEPLPEVSLSLAQSLVRRPESQREDSRERKPTPQPSSLVC